MYVPLWVKSNYSFLRGASHPTELVARAHELGLPASATKQTALEYISEALGIAKSQVVFCGDSGNDVYPLTAGFRGVLVRNADEQLVAGVNQELENNPDVVVYFAQGGCKGLNGYYTGGVIEGAYHYGLFQDDD